MLFLKLRPGRTRPHVSRVQKSAKSRAGVTQDRIFRGFYFPVWYLLWTSPFVPLLLFCVTIIHIRWCNRANGNTITRSHEPIVCLAAVYLLTSTCLYNSCICDVIQAPMKILFIHLYREVYVPIALSLLFGNWLACMTRVPLVWGLMAEAIERSYNYKLNKSIIQLMFRYVHEMREICVNWKALR